MTKLAKRPKADPLSKPERGLFKECEAIIRQGQESFMQVGAALQEIRDKRYYREQFANFDEYLGKRWSFQRQYAHRLISGSVAAEGLITMVSKVEVVPTTETQMRPLKALSLPQRKEAWNAAVGIAGGKLPTEKQVRAAVRQVSPKGDKSVPIGTSHAVARKALGLLKTISQPSKNISAAIEILKREIEGGAVNSNTE